jgi:hypothetical protein
LDRLGLFPDVDGFLAALFRVGSWKILSDPPDFSLELLAAGKAFTFIGNIHGRRCHFCSGVGQLRKSYRQSNFTCLSARTISR